MIIGKINSKEDEEKAITSIGQELIRRAKDITNDIERVTKIKINAEISADEVVNVNITKNYVTEFEEEKKNDN